MVPAGTETEVLDLTDHLVLPGLINAHSHSYGTLLKGRGDGLPLEPWMYYAMLVGRFTPDELRLAATLQVMECLQTGCTAFVDHLAREYAGVEVVLKVYSQAGVRAVVAPMISDRRYDESLAFGPGELTPEEAHAFARRPARPARDLLAECEALIRAWQGHAGRLSIMLGPSGPQRASDTLLSGCAALAAQYGVGIHTHLLETRRQAEAARRLYGEPMVVHLARLGFLTPHTSFAHGVWLTQPEIELLAQYGCSVVHNPGSNLALGSGIAPLAQLRAAGVNVALGTDGSNCGGSQSLWRSLRLAALLPRVSTPDCSAWPDPAAALSMATIGGAQALGIREQVGALAPGQAADLVAINLQRTAYQPLLSPLVQLVYGEDGSGIDLVMVGGRILFDHGRFTTIDAEAVLAEAGRLRTHLIQLEANWLDEVRLEYRATLRGRVSTCLS